MSGHNLDQKALDCLRLVADHPNLTFAEWRARYNDDLCERYSEKAVDTMYESLSVRGYLDYGVSPRMGWLTEKGEQVLGGIERGPA